MRAVTGDVAGPPPAGQEQGSERVLPLRSRSDRQSDRIRWVLLVCWLVVAVATLVAGERVASWQQVRDGVATGEVDSVRVVGEMRPGGRGYGVVEVHWREGLAGYTTDVVQVRGRQSPGSQAGVDGARTVIHEPPSSRLAALQPGLEVMQDRSRSTGARLLGWQIPDSLSLSVLLLFCVGLGVVAGGAEPWRATRWGWFWLSLPPLGCIVFLLLSGPTPGLPRPRDPQRRLTGGWAFLLSVVLMSILAPSP